MVQIGKIILCHIGSNVFTLKFEDFNKDACFETNCDDENLLSESNSENTRPQFSEEKKPETSISDVHQKGQSIKESISDKRVKKKYEKKRKYKRASKPQLFPLSKFPLKPRKTSLATLKRPDLYPKLNFNEEIFFKDDYPFLRHTSRDVMLSSTLPFQESPEYQELKETYVRLYEPQMRLQLGSSLPLNLRYHKIPANNKALPRL